MFLQEFSWPSENQVDSRRKASCDRFTYPAQLIQNVGGIFISIEFCRDSLSRGFSFFSFSSFFLNTDAHGDCTVLRISSFCLLRRTIHLAHHPRLKKRRKNVAARTEVRTHNPSIPTLMLTQLSLRRHGHLCELQNRHQAPEVRRRLDTVSWLDADIQSFATRVVLKVYCTGHPFQTSSLLFF